MTAFDPADTFSGNFPSIPPPTYHDNGGPLDVLHPWHPWDDDHTEAAPLFTALINECGVFATMFAVEERERARAADAGAAPVRRFVQPIHHTVPIPAIPAAIAAPIVYAELGPVALADEWDTGPALAIPAEAEAPRTHRRRGPGGRFISRAAS